MVIVKMTLKLNQCGPSLKQFMVIYIHVY